MGNYTIIAQAGQEMAALLQKAMVPEVVPKAEQIGLCHPGEPGEYQVGIYLYDVQESEAVRNAPRRRIGEEEQIYPSMYLDLYYMLVPFSRSDIKYRQSEEYKLLGKMIQVLRDYPDFHYDGDGTDGGYRVELLDIGYEDKVRIWNGLNEASHIALYCKVHPVELESLRRRSMKRVREIEMQFGEKDSFYG